MICLPGPFSLAYLIFTLFSDQEDEGELLEKVVEIILKEVPKTPLDVVKYPIGLNIKLKDFKKIVFS